MTTKRTLGILMTMALACTVSLGCTITTKDTATGGGGADQKGSGGAGQGGSGQGGSANPDGGGTDPGAGGSDPGTGGTDPGAGGGDPGTGGTDPGAGGGDPGTGGTGQAEHKIGCDKECEKVASASCENGPEENACKERCTREATHVAANTDCTDSFLQYYGCVNTATATCNAEGWPVIDGCGSQWDAAMTCLDSHAVGLPCDEACRNLVPSTECGTDDYESHAECMDECTEFTRDVLALTNCWNEYKAAVTCEATNTGKCEDYDEENKVWVIPACTEAYKTLNTCTGEGGEG